MPYIGTKTTVTITPEKELKLKALMGRAIEKIPGKTETWLMTEFTGDCHLYLAGDNSKPSAFVEVKIFGSAGKDAYSALTAEICNILEAELNIPADRVYVTYQGYSDWGWNGGNF